MKFNLDGTIDSMSGTNDTGAGEHQLVRIILAETIGAKLEDINCLAQGDTSMGVDIGSSGGSKQTKCAGTGTYATAMLARAKLFELATTGSKPLINAKPEDLDAKDSVVFLKSDPTKKATFKQIIASTPAHQIFSAYPIWPTGMQFMNWSAFFAEVNVDLETGSVEFVDALTAATNGQSINLLATEAQMDGGVVQAWGEAFGEENLADPTYGFTVNGSFVDFKTPVATDIAKKFTKIPIHVPDKIGAYGSTGFAEPALGSFHAAIANAISNAIGVPMTTTPVTRSKIIAAIASKKA